MAESDDRQEAEVIREAMGILGRRRTEAQQAARRENIAKARESIQKPGRKPWPLSRYECSCGRGDSTEGHAWDCPRGQAIKRRLKKGMPLE